VTVMVALPVVAAGAIRVGGALGCEGGMVDVVV
jgi:hypothetical protein